jgi:hypothetical protein
LGLSQQRAISTTNIEQTQLGIAISHSSLATVQVPEVCFHLPVDAGKVMALPAVAVGGVHAANGLCIVNHIQVNMRALATASIPALLDLE